ncbi:P-loop containing nucleoside triphosphate hydrolase protein [Podospora conica]|nr:P-loop containing nucleoside triphosphate hydrolase protein [Schizothecium conicum]
MDCADHPSPSQLSNINYSALLLLDGLGGPYIGGGDKFGIDHSGLEVKLWFVASKIFPSWAGFILYVPLGVDNENSGFGATLENTPNSSTLSPAPNHLIKVIFPRGGYTSTVTDVGGNITLADPLQKLEPLLRVEVNLDRDAEVRGLGMPFANDGHPSHGWVNEDAPLVSGHPNSTLRRVLSSRKVTFLITGKFKGCGGVQKRLSHDYLPPPFSYPYGEDHSWNMARYDEIIPQNETPTYEPFEETFVFESDNDLITSLTQGPVQDFYWLSKTVQALKSKKMAAYFVPKGGPSASLKEAHVFYAIVPRSDEFLTLCQTHWNRLCQQELFKIRVANGWADEAAPKTFTARILEHTPRDLQDHVSSKFPTDLALVVRCDYEDRLKVFDERGAAEALRTSCVSLEFDDGMQDTKRKVEGALCFAPNANPVPPFADDDEDGAFRMKLARDVMRGIGFYHTLTRSGTGEDQGPEGATANLTLPIVNFLNVNDVLLGAIVSEALPADQDRVKSYLSKRHLGIGLIAAPAGTGKTTALCQAILAMVFNPDIGRVFASGPTNIAVSNLAHRLYQRGVVVVDRYNTAAADKIRRPLVVRGFRLQEESRAFRNVLEHGAADDNAAPKGPWVSGSVWTYALTPVNWLLVVLRSKAARESKSESAALELHEDDHPALHKLRTELESPLSKYARLSQLVQGEIDWSEYKRGPGNIVTDDELESLLRRIISYADVVLSTPSQSCADGSPYQAAKLAAKGIAIDEAGCLSLPDLCCVWGNTLRPIFLAGDAEQLLPAVMDRRNRFASNLQLSALGFLQGGGFPVYRMRTQLRMCSDQFGYAQHIVYKKTGLELAYGPNCHPDMPQFAMGRAFDSWARGKFPSLKAAAEGTLTPIFMHVPNTVARLVGTSRLNKMQVEITLELLSSFVQETGYSAKGIVGISPYKPNVALANALLPKHPALAAMPPFKTVDSFQGLEGEMSVVIFGTNTHSKAGFTSQKNRLNVMLTRQKSMLLMVGDINVTGALTASKKKLEDLDRKAAKGLAAPGPDGQIVYSKAAHLRELLTMINESGRFFEMRHLEGEKQLAEARAKKNSEKEDKEVKEDKGKDKGKGKENAKGEGGENDEEKGGKTVKIEELAEGEVLGRKRTSWADEVEEELAKVARYAY